MFLRRTLLAAALLTLAACGSNPKTEAPPARAFVSDRIIVTTAGGDGPDVILVPGLTSSARIWNGTVAALPKYRYHIVQVRGFAGVPPGANVNGPVSAPVAEEIFRYIDEQQLMRPSIIGHSMGGTIAMMVAARHPNSVSRVMVVDMMPFLGAMFGPPGATPESVKPVADQIRAAMTSPLLDGARRGMAEKTINSMIATESERPAAINDTMTSDRGTAANAYHELIVTDLRPELKNISVPLTVLYVQPQGVPITEAQLDDYYALSYASVPNRTIKRIPNARHFIMFDQKQAFEAEVTAFMAR